MLPIIALDPEPPIASPGNQEERHRAVNKTRPVNLDFGTIDLPITAKASIMHRASGVFLVAGIAVLLYLLDLSLRDADGFARAAGMLSSVGARFVLWVVLAAVIFHTIAGIKHLLMDIGIGESKEGGILAARLTFGISALLMLAAGVWLW